MKRIRYALRTLAWLGLVLALSFETGAAQNLAVTLDYDLVLALNIETGTAQNLADNFDDDDDRELTAEISADGIDEILQDYVPHRFDRDAWGDADATLHFHATDGEGEWLVTVTDGEVAWEHSHAKGDVAARAPSSGRWCTRICGGETARSPSPTRTRASSPF